MTKLTGAALDRAVANAMGLKSVNNCEQWGKEMTYKTIEEWIEHNPNHRGALPIEVCHQIFGTKDTQIEIEEDDDIQDYKRPWVGLHTTTILDIYAETLKEHRGGSMPDGQIAFAKAIEQALKERNT